MKKWHEFLIYEFNNQIEYNDSILIFFDQGYKEVFNSIMGLTQYGWELSYKYGNRFLENFLIRDYPKEPVGKIISVFEWFDKEEYEREQNKRLQEEKEKDLKTIIELRNKWNL